MLMRAMKKEHPPERDYVKRFNIMLNAELSFVEHDWAWFFDGDDGGKADAFEADEAEVYREVAEACDQRHRDDDDAAFAAHIGVRRE